MTMDTRSGQIASMEHFRSQLPPGELEKFIRPIDVNNLNKMRLVELVNAGTTTVSPRSRCPCGSGRRFKSCCMYKALHAAPANKQEPT